MFRVLLKGGGLQRHRPGMGQLTLALSLGDELVAFSGVFQ